VLPRAGDRVLVAGVVVCSSQDADGVEEALIAVVSAPSPK